MWGECRVARVNILEEKFKNAHFIFQLKIILAQHSEFKIFGFISLDLLTTICLKCVK